MSISKEEIKLAVEYAEQLEITASLDPKDEKTLRFHRNPPPPAGLSEETMEIIEICIEYHQRSVFTGEYLAVDDNPPVHESTDAIGDINFNLNHYKNAFVTEVKKGLATDQENEQFEPKKKISQYAKAMLEFRKKQKK
ncbi:MAG: hypothetical protein GY866_40320 [Proteobacteria bacterium]|nr:hypothetical protein [Pseudomonadota bacterium]